MSSDTNKAIVKRYLEEVWNNGHLDLLEEFFADDIVEHGIERLPGMSGRESLTAIIGGLRAAVPDINVTVEDLLAEGDKVVVRSSVTGTHQGELLGVPGTGKFIRINNIGILRLAEARIVEIWNLNDTLGLMQQIGAIPAPAAS